MPKTKGIQIKPKFRSGLEKVIAKQLEGAQVPFGFEKFKMPYAVPSRIAKYLPDFFIEGTPIIIEGKGWFGRSGAKERQKFLLLKEQYPEYDIRFVFTDATKPLYKGSPTTYAMWAEEHGFLWGTKGVIPTKWLQEMKQWTKKKSTTKSSPSKTPARLLAL